MAFETNCVMLIRHAEKPAGGRVGIGPQGLVDPQSLSVVGWQRAGALVPFFAPVGHRGHVPGIERPLHLLAARPVQAHPSTRPRDTLLPLAEALALDVDEQWSTDDPPSKVAEHLRTLQGPALVCWRHEALPALARELLQRDEAPAAWPEARFDVVWVFRRAGVRWTFQQVAQQLLAEDRGQPIPRRVSARAA
ncbi:histidine phosphatase family protein [Aquincola sp. MAHUQ-54]|uniref:Histidine phosphatase family protein n=1 Tax=Aquincola agrisoli TaxID=3119538 RepID=A0AAW9QI00_9BURK